MKNRLWQRAIILIILLPGLTGERAAGQDLPKGNLVIVGGGLEDDNKEIYEEMIRFAGGNEKASFAVIPSASGVAVQSFVSFKKALISYGVSSSNIHLIPIAMVDDDSTTNVDESKWSTNGNDSKLAELVRSCSAVWFTGGDQMRTTKTLFLADGSQSLVLKAVWDVYLTGGVIGGSSAGAAIMSEVMIGGGNSIGALMHGVITDYKGDDFPEGDGVLMTIGLGFFPFGIVDQHFDQRGRTGRLIVALLHEKDRFNMGFGVDENTALIYDSKLKKLKVAGAAGVTIINSEKANYLKKDSLLTIMNLIVSRLEKGDSYDLTTGTVIPAEGKRSTIGNEYYNIENPGQAGILSGYSSEFRDLLTVNLMDNKGASIVQNLSFYNHQRGFQITLSKTSDSQGFYTDEPDGEDHYTVVDVKMDIIPVKILINTMK
jgi:cyanophycinase